MTSTKSLPRAKLQFVPPMLAAGTSLLPEGPAWSYEVKLDGYRALIVKTNRDVCVYSRRGRGLGHLFPDVADAFRCVPPGTILDGEIVALGGDGKPCFSGLQNWKDGTHPLCFYAFDLLACDGKDVRELPFFERRQLLEKTVLQCTEDPVRISQRFDVPLADLIAAVREHRLEGIVAKRLDSPYESGQRTGAWMKMRIGTAEEFVIGGYTVGGRHFDSLIVGHYRARKFMFTGRVRAGLTPLLRQSVAKQLEGLRIEACPFTNLPESRKGKWGDGFTNEDMKNAVWLRPELVAMIEYAEFTIANHLRHPRLVRLQEHTYSTWKRTAQHDKARRRARFVAARQRIERVPR